MSQELEKQKTTELQIPREEAEEVAQSILTLFRFSVKHAGNYKEEEYQALHQQAENRIKMWLSDLLARIPQ